MEWWLKPAVDRKWREKRDSDLAKSQNRYRDGNGAPADDAMAGQGLNAQLKQQSPQSWTTLTSPFVGQVNKTIDGYMGDPFKKLEDKEGKTFQLHERAEVFDEKTEMIFSYLQVFTAIVDSIGHGANDVANSIGPYAAVIGIYNSGVVESKEDVPEWILAFGGIGITVGLALYGYRIIESIGVELIKVTPTRGFAIELGAAIVIVFGSGVWNSSFDDSLPGRR